MNLIALGRRVMMRRVLGMAGAAAVAPVLQSSRPVTLTGGGAAGGSGMQGPQTPYWTDQVVRRVPTPNPPDWIRALADESEKYLAAWTDRRKLRMKGLDADIDCLRLPRATKVRMQLRRDDKIESEHSSMYEKYEVALKAFLGRGK